MVEAGTVIESGSGENGLGRKSMLFKYNAKHGYVIGGDIGRNEIRIVLADLAGTVVNEIMIGLNNGMLTEKTLEELNRDIDQMLLKRRISPERILLVCIGVPYRIDSTSRANYLSLTSDNPENTRLDQYFEQKFGVDILVENSINLGAIGEKYYGAGRNFNDIFYIDFGVGIGSAMLLDGKPFCGHNGAAGEISYCITDTNRLRTVYSDDGILEELVAVTGKKLGLHLDSHNHIQEMKPAFDRALQNDRDAQEFLDLLARHFGVLLVNVTSLINPEVIIFSGRVGVNLLERYYNTFLRMLSAHVPFVPHLVPSVLRKKGNCLGAVSVAVEHLHKDYSVLEGTMEKIV